MKNLKSKNNSMICYWCSKSLHPHNQSKVAICQSCHTAFSDAEISDMEHFQDDLTSSENEQTINVLSESQA